MRCAKREDSRRQKVENRLNELLGQQEIIVLDGALATELENRGLSINDALWSAKILAEKPEEIQAVHYDYFCAGADIGISASYQATIPGFLAKGYTEQQADELIKQSVRILAKARERFWQEKGRLSQRAYPILAASVGPYGAYLADGSEYRGNYGLSEEALFLFHRERMHILWEAGAEVFACETIPSLAEAKALARCMQEIPGANGWICFSCKNEKEICEGTPIAECAAQLEAAECISAIGVNCTAPEYVEGLIREIRSVTNKPVVVYPNSGEQYNAVEKSWHGTTGVCDYAHWAKTWYAAGARLIGGCCRTTPKDIAQISVWSRGK